MTGSLPVTLPLQLVAKEVRAKNPQSHFHVIETASTAGKARSQGSMLKSSMIDSRRRELNAVTASNLL